MQPVNSGIQWYLGVDGGGSTCRVRLCSASGQRLAEAKGGPANVRLGTEQVAQTVLAVTREALQIAGLDDSAMSQMSAGLGLAGIGRDTAPPIPAELSSAFAKCQLRHDAHIACLGAHHGEPGGIAIVGTGSCVHLIDKNGGTQTLGGLGFPLSDHAGGAWIGRKAVRHALQAMDGLAECSKLSETIVEQIGTDPFDFVAWAERAIAADYARFAPLVFNLAEQGNAQALAIREQAVRALSHLLSGADKHGQPSIALLGGLAALYQPLLSEAVQSKLCAARADALDGALILAGFPVRLLG